MNHIHHYMYNSFVDKMVYWEKKNHGIELELEHRYGASEPVDLLENVEHVVYPVRVYSFNAGGPLVRDDGSSRCPNRTSIIL